LLGPEKRWFKFPIHNAAKHVTVRIARFSPRIS
jgi:hypothetical protein